jgi:hypothetical protein
MIIDFHVGHTDEWGFFHRHYGPVIESILNAHDAVLDLLQESSPQEGNEAVLYFLGQSCLKEFEEILLLVGNGYGSGAQKLLRSYYERVVTFGYLAQHPEKIPQFIAYSDIHWFKLLKEARLTHSETNLSPEREREIEAKAAAVKAQFTVPDCETCKTERFQISWTKAPLETQARQLDELLRKLYFNAYLKTTFYLHTTYFALETLSRETVDGKVTMFGSVIEHAAAYDGLKIAHMLLIRAAITINEVFKLENDDVLKVLGKDFEQWEEVEEISSKAKLPGELPES